LLSKGYNKNGGELTMYSANADELAKRTGGQNREMIHDSKMATSPVSSGVRRFSEGKINVSVIAKSLWVAIIFS